jgi:hypothetical protein
MLEYEELTPFLGMPFQGEHLPVSSVWDAAGDVSDWRPCDRHGVTREKRWGPASVWEKRGTEETQGTSTGLDTFGTFFNLGKFEGTLKIKFWSFMKTLMPHCLFSSQWRDASMSSTPRSLSKAGWLATRCWTFTSWVCYGSNMAFWTMLITWQRPMTQNCPFLCMEWRLPESLGYGI